MKQSKAPIPIRTDARPLGFWDFIRWVMILTLGVTAVAVGIAAVQCNVDVWALSAVLWFLAILAIWIGTLTVDSLVVIPVEICRLGERLVGDALGAAVEFKSPGSFAPVTGYRHGGPHRLEAGEWTDDTSMALALADSIATAGWDLNDQADRYVQ